jgi:hypothetical protein
MWLLNKNPNFAQKNYHSTIKTIDDNFIFFLRKKTWKEGIEYYKRRIAHINARINEIGYKFKQERDRSFK